MAKTFTITEFFRRFPDDDACLAHLMKVRYGDTLDCLKCGKHGHFSRLKKLPAYSCPWCGHHIHPMQGTPFERSRTPLQKWFYAMYLFTTTRNGVAAKELQRQLGVTYKTAWRIGHEIRKYMAWVDGDSPLGGSGIVEVDKAYIGGRRRPEEKFDNKTMVLGMVERDGEIITRIVRSRRFDEAASHFVANVKQGARVASDESTTFINISRLGFRHQWVNHAKKEWVRGEVHTNTIEGFWAWLKRGINGTHVWISAKHMPKYLGEFEFRFNLRNSPNLMFDFLLAAFPRP
ncbi:MAG: IS1595 family transposase [Alphaproteobacteria bacterium]|nr:IS1595 family transposase [Alphaproteobacteria bacterium]